MSEQGSSVEWPLATETKEHVPVLLFRLIVAICMFIKQSYYRLTGHAVA
jgi:hypothetical protein